MLRWVGGGEGHRQGKGEDQVAILDVVVGADRRW